MNGVARTSMTVIVASGRGWGAAIRVLLLALAALFGSPRVSPAQTGSTIVVSSTCSLAQAIQAANFDSNIGVEGCTAGSGDDTIQLPAGQVLRFTTIFDDAYSAFGPAALPLVFTNITIEGNGARLEAAPPAGVTFRAFSVGETEMPGPDGIMRSGKGNLTIRNLHIKGFAAKGGDGRCGGGGGMGAGGAIYAGPGSVVTIESSTLESNGAIGGNATGGVDCVLRTGLYGPSGGGGGIGGDGGLPDQTQDNGQSGAGGGGGGARGHGGNARLDTGGGGGGTQASSFNLFGATRCGGDGGTGIGQWFSGSDANCPGGGGGGAGQPRLILGFIEGGAGGDGHYGGGGGGGGASPDPAAFEDGHYGEHGGKGGFGGGGGGCGGVGGAIFSNSGGASTFGGGGGACKEIQGASIFFGGHGGTHVGGSGAGLGGGVFSDAATVTIANSTFTANYAVRGVVAEICDTCGRQAEKGNDLGGAVFAFQGSLTILNSTIAGNENTGSHGGVVYLNERLRDPALDLFCQLVEPIDPNNELCRPPGTFTLRNSIIAHNGVNFDSPAECSVAGVRITVAGSGNLILRNDTAKPCPGVVQTIDPLLLPLRLNAPGLTPTMAILTVSHAAGTADPATSLDVDQRGVARPQFDAPDIGAYEARQPTFDVQVTSPISVELGGTATSTVTVSSVDSFANPVDLNSERTTSGLLVFFDRQDVQPSSGVPATFTLTVRAGSDVVAGAYTITLVFSSAAIGTPITIRVPVTVIVGVSSGGMARTIADFTQIGDIANVGIATALTSKLTASQALIDSGDVQAGINTLAAFGFQVRALSGKLIATAAASRLLANLDLLIADVGQQLTPNPLLGTVVDAAGSPIAGAAITIMDAKKVVVGKAETDASGFCYVARTTGWAAGTPYSVIVSPPKGYKKSAPSLQTVTWGGSQIVLPAFVLSK